MREEKKGFPYDPAPDVNRFPGVPESGFDLVNEYGTYNIQPTVPRKKTRGLPGASSLCTRSATRMTHRPA